jgi:DNA-directed RNA polymerase subunit RPC12/RpoP
MSKNFVNRHTIQPKCTKCNTKYNLTVASNKAERKLSRQIYCPHCNSIQGKLN